MSIDVQLNVGFLDNWKIVKLRRRLGADAVLSLIKLWCATRTSKPDGNLGIVTPEDLEILSSWSGPPNAFYETIRDLSLIDETQDGVLIHDWHEHEAYAVKKTEKRQANIENGRKGGKKRVENLRERQAMACESSSDGLKTLEESSSDGLKTSRLSVAKCSVAECSEEKNSIAGVQGETVAAEPPIKKPSPKVEDARAVRIYEHYMKTIEPIHPPARKASLSNISGLLRRLREDKQYSDKSLDELVDYLFAVVNRYKRSSTYVNMSSPRFRYAARNFFGIHEEWRSFAWDSSPAMLVTVDEKPTAEKKRPEQIEAEKCARRPGNQGCIHGREPICAYCPNKQAKPKSRYVDRTSASSGRLEPSGRDDGALLHDLFGPFDEARG